MKSDLERAFLTELKYRKLPQPECEYSFIPGRRFRIDFAYPEQRIAVEVEGGAFVQGRHVRGDGFEKDCEKYNLAQLNGWLLLRITGNHIKNGTAFVWLSDALELRSA